MLRYLFIRQASHEHGLVRVAPPSFTVTKSHLSGPRVRQCALGLLSRKSTQFLLALDAKILVQHWGQCGSQHRGTQELHRSSAASLPQQTCTYDGTFVTDTRLVGHLNRLQAQGRLNSVYPINVKKSLTCNRTLAPRQG